MNLNKCYITTSDQVKIYYESYHNNAVNVIVLIHGFQCSSKFFHKNIEALSKSYRVVCMDLRCHGQSDSICNDCTLKRMGQDIKELIDTLKLENVHLLGWSMGGNVVMEYYKQFGSKHLASIGLIDSRLYPYSDEAWNTHSCRGFNEQAALERKENMLKDYEGYCRSLVHRYYVQLPELAEQQFVTNEVLKTNGPTMWQIYYDFLKDDCYSELKNVDIPVFVAATRHIGDDTGKHYLSQVRKGEYQFFSCGHCMMLEKPEQFNEVVCRFVDSNKN